MANNFKFLICVCVFLSSFKLLIAQNTILQPEDFEKIKKNYFQFQTISIAYEKIDSTAYYADHTNAFDENKFAYEKGYLYADFSNHTSKRHYLEYTMRPNGKKNLHQFAREIVYPNRLFTNLQYSIIAENINGKTEHKINRITGTLGRGKLRPDFAELWLINILQDSMLEHFDLHSAKIEKSTTENGTNVIKFSWGEDCMYFDANTLLLLKFEIKYRESKTGKILKTKEVWASDYDLDLPFPFPRKAVIKLYSFNNRLISHLEYTFDSKTAVFNKPEALGEIVFPVGTLVFNFRDGKNESHEVTEVKGKNQEIELTNKMMEKLLQEAGIKIQAK